MAILDGEQVMYIAHVPNKRRIRYTGSVGYRSPADGTSLGPVLWAGLDDAALDERLARAPYPAWYEGLRDNDGGDASNFARYYRVPGMSRCGVGPSTDQFDMLPALVDWVERGKVPESIRANARGPGNAVGVNPDVPAIWSPTRSRPLCPYPQVARLKTGATDLESADSFQCQ